MFKQQTMLMAVLAATTGLATGAALAQAGPHAATGDRATAQVRSDASGVGETELQGAREVQMMAVQVVQQMKSDPGMSDALSRSRGVFIIRHYGRGALGVGVQGGEGVLVTRQGQGFSNPVFYNLAGISLGLQAGGSGGPVALLLMTDRAVQDFRSGKKFSMNADAGLTFGDWSRRAQVSGGKVQDVVVWSGTKGAFAGASVGFTDVMLDEDANRAFYGRDQVTPSEILDDRIPNPRNKLLERVLGA